MQMEITKYPDWEIFPSLVDTFKHENSQFDISDSIIKDADISTRMTTSLIENNQIPRRNDKKDDQ